MWMTLPASLSHPPPICRRKCVDDLHKNVLVINTNRSFVVVAAFLRQTPANPFSSKKTNMVSSATGGSGSGGDGGSYDGGEYMIAGLTAVVYFVAKWIEHRMVRSGEEIRWKDLVWNSILVFISVLGGQFLLMQLQPTLHTVDITPAFTDNPDF